MTLARDPVADGLRTVVDLFRMRARLQPDFVGYRFLPDGDARAIELTYAELDRQARSLAARLQSRVPRGGRALLQIQSDLNFIVAFAGCLYAGVIPVPTMVPHRNRPSDGLCAIAQDCEPDIILTTSGILASMNPALTTAPALQGRPWPAVDAIDGDSPAWRDVEIAPEEIAFLQYTSGSTSAPKGVMVSHANILHNESMIRDACGHAERTVVVGWLPFFHDMGLIGNILQPLYVGAPCTLMPPAMVLQRPLRWLQAVSRYRATTSGGPNFVYDLCVTRIKPEQAASLDSPPGSLRSTAPSRFSVTRSSASPGPSRRAAFAPRRFTRAMGSPKRRCAFATTRRSLRRPSSRSTRTRLSRTGRCPRTAARRCGIW